ncbi:hypothetical protein [Hymenobacter sp. BRD67]|uniref:hypothetical protein n=1 Tax=Hymenobacter sp. BRD67 TaxID=2675877 RepID=UPI001564E2EE|nr:hypothetical protein [Hymenobacter sp. BRD67]QKG54140.1 hypothetical protein GKZ67_17990 [Hymenobacter sp. BRD67]
MPPLNRYLLLAMDSTQWTGLRIVLAFLLLFLGVGYHLYAHAQQLNQDVVSFTTRFWGFDIGWLLFILGMLTAGLWMIILLIVKPGTILLGLLAGAAMFCLWLLVFTYVRLYWSYWRYDRDRILMFNKTDDLLLHGFATDSTAHKISDVTLLTHYAPKNSKLSWNYTILTFLDGSKALVTYLLCDSDDLRQLLPVAKFEIVRLAFPWLPIEPLSQAA